MTKSIPQLKLIYFPIRGKAEAIRLALHLGSIPFEDERIGFEQFSAIKDSLPYGQLPVLHIDGMVVAQSAPLLRYVGTLANLYPVGDAIKCLLIDQIIAQLDDINNSKLPSIREKDPVRKAEMRKQVVEVIFPKHFADLEKVLNGQSGRFVLGDELSIADLVMYSDVSVLKTGVYDGLPVNFTDAYPKLTHIYENVAAMPKIVEWELAHPSKHMS